MHLGSLLQRRHRSVVSMSTPLVGGLDAVHAYAVFQSSIQYAFAEIVAPFMIETIVFGTLVTESAYEMCTRLTAFQGPHPF